MMHRALGTGREKFETENHLQKEKDFAFKLARIWALDMRKLPARYRIDYAACSKNQIYAVVECKCRNIPSTQYDYFMMAADKFMTGKTLASEINQTFIVAVRFAERDMFYRYDPRHQKYFQYSWRGRTINSRDKQDQEICVLIPMNLFDAVRETN